MMAFQIEMEKVSREMNLQNDLIEEEKYKKIIKKKVEMQKKQKEYELEENWDEYESDWINKKVFLSLSVEIFVGLGQKVINHHTVP